MPTAPSLLPSVGPSGQGTPSFSPAADANSFGGSVAGAIQSLGKTVEGAGNELFARAAALQTLNNDAEAKEADTEYMIQAGLLHAEFNSLQGKNAVDAYPKYVENLEQSRIAVRGSLSNPAATKLFDASSRGVMARTVFNGAGYAAGQNKQYLFNASQNRVEALQDTALSNPKDDKAFDRTTQDIIDEVEQQGAIGGWDQSQIDNMISKKTSETWAKRIKGLARTEPLAAQDMLEKNRDKIRGQDLEPTTNFVSTQVRTVSARNISDATNAGWGSYMRQPDIDKTVGIEASLLEVVKKAQRDNPDLEFTIGGQGGTRTPAQQAELVRQGRSKTMNSNHLGGRAIDLVPIVNGKPNHDAPEADMMKIRAAMTRASEELGIPLGKPIGWDPAHYDLPRDYDVGKAPKPVPEGEQSRVARATAQMRKHAPDDAIAVDAVQSRTMADFNRDKTMRTNAEFDRRMSIEQGLMGDGKTLPTTVEELKAQSPETAAAWDSLRPDNQRKYLSILEKNSKDDVPMNTERFNKVQQLRGMAQSDPVKFLDQDISSMELPRSSRASLLELQRKKKANSEADPRVTRAMKIMSQDLEAAGISKSKDAASYEQFVGDLQDALELWQQDNKATPKPKEVQELGARVLQQQSVGLFSREYDPKGYGSKPFYQLTPPEEEVKRIRSDPQWEIIGVTPTDKMVERIYKRDLFQKLYGRPKASPDRPQVPQSK